MKQDGVLIELDRDRELRLSYKAIKLLKSKFEIDVMKINTATFDLETVAKIFFVSLLHEDPTLTYEQTEDLIDDKPLKYCLGKVTELMESTFEMEDKESPNTKALKVTE